MNFTDDLDADRRFIDQFEEIADTRPDVAEWLDDVVYRNAESMSAFGCSLLPPEALRRRKLQHSLDNAEQVWRSVIPPEYQPQLDGKSVVTAGFGAGPGCIAQHTEDFDPPISLDQGLIWLERWRSTFKRGRLVLGDGAILWFDPHGFTGYEGQGRPQPQKRIARPHRRNPERG